MARAAVPALRRLTASGLVALWLFGLAASLAHASHAHRFCEEHGAFEEAGARPAAATPGDGQAAVHRAAAPASGHQACAFTGPGAPFTPEPEARVAVQPAPAPVAIVVPDARPAVHPIDLLALAPKSSPPSVSI
jgi:hypothetical protein